MRDSTQLPKKPKEESLKSTLPKAPSLKLLLKNRELIFQFGNFRL